MDAKTFRPRNVIFMTVVVGVSVLIGQAIYVLFIDVPFP
jgi:hypothetical protein